jgi:hypothetical protein
MAGRGISLCFADHGILYHYTIYRRPFSRFYSFTQKTPTMEKRWNGEFLQGLEELPEEKMTAITGGESLWYWVGYAIGGVGYMLTHLTPEQSGGQKLMNAALG